MRRHLIVATLAACGAAAPALAASTARASIDDFTFTLYDLNPFDGIAFTLAPHTLAVFSGTADLFAQTTVGVEPGGFAGESGRAVVGMTISGVGAGGSGNQSSTDALLTGTFANDTAGSLSLFASAQGASAVAAVPEPAQTTLLLAGLAVTGLIVRRRQAVIADR